MAYIGRQLTSGNYLKLDDISSQFNGSTTQFNLTSGGQAFYPGSPFSILVSLAGIIQEPDSSYQINESTITFAIAPQASDDFFCIALGTSLGIGVPGEQTVTGTKLSKPFNYDNGLLYLDDTNDYIGIGTDNPQSKLQVDGKVRVGGATTFTEDLVVTGDARVTGILTIGTGSITLDPNAKKISGIDEILIGEVGTANTITIKQNNGRVEFRDILGKERQVSIGTDVSINTTGIITSSTLNVGTGITLSGTQIDVGSATTIHTTGFQIGNSFLHSSGLDLGSGNIISHNINSTGIITATSFSGDGSALTGIDATALKDSGGNVKVQANESGVFITGVATATSFSGDGSALTGITAGATLSDSSGSERVVLTGQTSGTMTATSTSSNLTFNSSTNTLNSSNIVSSGSVSASQSGGFYSSTYAAGRNPIWRFANADAYGISYFQSTGGYDGSTDTIGLHFGTATAAASQFYVAGNGNARISNYFVVGGNYSNNAYDSVSGTKLMFGGGDGDAQGNYFIGTNLENYGGNYNKLDFRWHTGIRMGAQTQYGGVRIFNNEDLGTQLVQFNGSSEYSYFASWINVSGHQGMYSSTNSAHIYPNNGSYGSWRIDGSRNGWYGIESGDTAVTLMMNTDSYGFHYNGVGWRLYNNGGSLYVPGDITAYWSDIRLKENIIQLTSGVGIDIINKLKPSKFNWKQSAHEYNDCIKSGKEEVGLIAQEVQEIISDAVVENKSGTPANGKGENYLTINYNKITPYLIQAVKDLTEKVEKLQEEINQLRGN